MQNKRYIDYFNQLIENRLSDYIDNLETKDIQYFIHSLLIGVEESIFRFERERKVFIDGYLADNYQKQLLSTPNPDGLDFPDIRNKLSTITTLVSLFEVGEYEYVEKVLPQVKDSINYLAGREVYERIG